MDSRFNCASLLWMLRRKTLYSELVKIHHKALKVIYGSSDTYDGLLLQGNAVSVHQIHLRFLMTGYIKTYRN